MRRLLADLTIYFLFTPADALLQTIVEWGRDAELFDYDAAAGTLTLVGE
jgi:hypothetical protein